MGLGRRRDKQGSPNAHPLRQAEGPNGASPSFDASKAIPPGASALSSIEPRNSSVSFSPSSRIAAKII